MLMTVPLIQTTNLCQYAQEKSSLTKVTGSFYTFFLKFVLNCCKQWQADGLSVFLICITLSHKNVDEIKFWGSLL